jgi:hypothetical protein
MNTHIMQRTTEDDGKGRTGWGRYEIVFNPPGHGRGYWLLTHNRTVCGPYSTREACQLDNPWAIENA